MIFICCPIRFVGCKDIYIYYVEHVRQTLTFHIIFFMRGFDYHLIRLKVQASIFYVGRVRQRQTFSHHVLHEEWQQGNLFTPIRPRS